MRCVRCGLPFHRRLKGECYYCKRKADEAQAELDEWVPTE